MAIYALIIFLSAFLLFQIQPIIARFILPWFGGTPAVWTTCMLFFQLVLLIGYSYAHRLARVRSARLQGRWHVALLLLSLLTLPIVPSEFWKTAGEISPILRIVALLCLSVGFPYFLLSTTGPLLQHWFLSRHPGRSPYRLYALSNAGSLLALLTYPLLVEPYWRLGTQAIVWSVLFGIFVMVTAGLSWKISRQPLAQVEGPESRPPESGQPESLAALPYSDSAVRDYPLIWLALSGCASLLLLATTNLMCQNVAVVPFLWILPLLLYLLSFILCFERPNGYSRLFWGIAFMAMVGGAIVILITNINAALWIQIGVYSGTLFAGCMVCHGELARHKPAPAKLTKFYLLISAGGALGGLFVALIAPFLFRNYQEYHLGLICALLLAQISYQLDWLNISALKHGLLRLLKWRLFSIMILWGLLGRTAWVLVQKGINTDLAGLLAQQFVDALGNWRSQGSMIVGLLLVVLLLLGRIARICRRRLRQGQQVAWLFSTIFLGAGVASLTSGLIAQSLSRLHETIAQERNFYGVLKVEAVRDSAGEINRAILRHGQIIHGAQFLAPTQRNWPTCYYGEQSGIGLAIARFPGRSGPTPAPLHLGVVGLGTGTIAAYGQPGDRIDFYEINPAVIRYAQTYFTFLPRSLAKIQVFEGDARQRLEEQLQAKAPADFDILAVDAFSSDAIPMHLITRECLAIYLAHLKKNGILAFHISNRYLNLRPVIRGLAGEFQLETIWINSERIRERAVNAASWVLLTKNSNFLHDSVIAGASKPWPANDPAPIVWHDDYGSLLSLLK
jgi:hypothetical protein